MFIRLAKDIKKIPKNIYDIDLLRSIKNFEPDKYFLVNYFERDLYLLYLDEFEYRFGFKYPYRHRFKFSNKKHKVKYFYKVPKSLSRNNICPITTNREYYKKIPRRPSEKVFTKREKPKWLEL